MAWRQFLTVDRDGTKLTVRIHTMLSGIERPAFFFTSDRGNEIDAECIARHLRDELAALVQNARADAYDKGYRDGRGKRAKMQSQPCGLGREVP